MFQLMGGVEYDLRQNRIISSPPPFPVINVHLNVLYADIKDKTSERWPINV
jgi:hypothetical protein